MLRRRPLIPAVLALLVLLLAPVAARADSRQESMFQDDDHLVFASTAVVTKTMDTLKLLGVDRVRVSVIWRNVAPGARSPDRPAFDASDPNGYAAAAWAPFDRIVRLARARRIAVNFNVTAPAPNWATGTPERTALDQTYTPNVAEFGRFVQALGRRYSGAWTADGSLLPRVRYWTIWNEPNQGAWLTPQYVPDPSDKRGKRFVESSPVLYRSLVDAAWAGLALSGHTGDTVLIGETAPKGASKLAPGVSTAMSPLRFLRTLYCVDENLQLLRGTAATLRGCPTGADALAAFPRQHPALFQATGYAHHPYELVTDPTRRPDDPDSVTIANLDKLQGILRRLYQRYRQPLPGGGRGVPLYLTEFGFQSNPPDPTGSSLADQAAFLNQSEYVAYRNRDVHALSQFLLIDGKPIKASSPLKAYGTTFQTGLRFLDGRNKPAYAAYALGLYLPSRRVAPGRRLTVWGVARAAPKDRAVSVRVDLRVKGRKAFRKIGTLRTDARSGYLLGQVKVPRSGAVRLVWRSGSGRTWVSRAASFTVAG